MKPFVPAIIWLLIILVLSGYPGNEMPKVAIWQFDKLIHALIYSMLSVLLLLALNKQYEQGSKRLQLAIKVILFGVLYGALMEIFQENIFINRDGNWYDFIANTIGAILGVLVYPLIIKYLPIIKWLRIN